MKQLDGDIERMEKFIPHPLSIRKNEFNGRTNSSVSAWIFVFW
jgi:hypothetical protein